MSTKNTKNLTVLHVTTANKTRGIADYTHSMISELEAQGIQNDIHFIDAKNLTYLSQTELKQNFAACYTKAKKADVIHIQHEFGFFSQQSVKHSITVFYAFLRPFTKIKKPVVITFHTEAEFFKATLPSLFRGKNFLTDLKNYRLQRDWHKKINRLLNHVSYFHAIVHTQKTQQTLVNSGISPEKLTIIPVGISPRNHSVFENKIQAKQALNYPSNSILLSLFGFITENKGHEFAIKALELLPSYYHLAIIGGPHPEAKNSNIEKILALSHFNTALKERIRITGYVNEKEADLYHAATDICLAPYHSNMSGSAAIGWALTSGKPIIASRTATFNEINQEAECLLMCEEKSAFELAWQIQNLISDSHLQKKLVENALKYAADCHWTKIGKKIITCYEKFCYG